MDVRNIIAFVRRCFVWIFIFAISSVFIGEIYLDFVSNEIVKADFFYSLSVRDLNDKKDYVDDLKILKSELDIEVYAVEYKQINSKSAKYIVYSSDSQREQLQNELHLLADKTILKSALGKRLEVIFFPFECVSYCDGSETYYAFGTKESMIALRSSTIDKYGMSKPEDASYDSHKENWVTIILAIVVLLYFISILFQTSLKRKEILAKYINGYSLNKMVFLTVSIDCLQIVVSALVRV